MTSREVQDAIGEAPEREAPRWDKQVGKDETRLADLERKAASLEEQEGELTRRIAAVHAGDREGDLAALTGQRREVRALREDIVSTLPILRERVAVRRVAAAEGAVKKWLGGDARRDAEQARAGVTRAEERVRQLEAKVRAAREEAEAHRARAQLLSNVGEALIQAFEVGTAGIEPPAPPPGKVARPDPGLVRRVLAVDDLRRAVERAVQAVGDEDLAAAVRVLLATRPPRSREQLMAERRERADAPHRAEIARVDAWLQAQLAAGPACFADLVRRATKAGIAVTGRSKLGWGRATLHDAGFRIRAFVVVRDDDPTTSYWTLQGVEGFHVPLEVVHDARIMHALRA